MNCGEHGTGCKRAQYCFFLRAGLDLLLKHKEKDDSTEVVTLEALACEIAGQDYNAEQAVELAENAEEEHLSVHLELRCLAQARSILECHGNFLGQCHKAFLPANARSDL